MSETLEARGLVKKYKARAVVNGVSFSVKRGEVVGLLGPNGAGKTTSFSMTVGLVKADAGEVTLGAESLTRDPMYMRARKGLGYLPQESCIFRKLTVKENLLAALEVQKKHGPAERLERARAVLAEFGLSHLADELGETLSGGERRRCEIARSLIQQPKFMLFDEPFAGVDPLNVAELQKEMARLAKQNLGVLITDHNVRDTLKICDRAYIIAEGKILEEGTPTQLANSPVARSNYLGSNFVL
jgi:lipopolysaccharide export system ATP-binding protein